MNASKRILLLIFALLITVPVCSKSYIKMKKKIWATSTKSMTNTDYVEAFIDENNRQICLCFYQDFGQVWVSLLTSTGEVIHAEPVNTTTTPTAEICLDEPLPSADYMLLITNKKEEFYGTFSID